MTDQTTDLRDQYARAIRDAVRVRLGTNSLRLAEEGRPVMLNYSEAEAAADAVLAVQAAAGVRDAAHQAAGQLAAHACPNCEGIDPATCLMNPSRAAEQPAAECPQCGDTGACNGGPCAHPAADGLTLRDRLRRAVCEAEGFAWDSDMLEPDEYGDHADAVLTVLAEHEAASRRAEALPKGKDFAPAVGRQDATQPTSDETRARVEEDEARYALMHFIGSYDDETTEFLDAYRAAILHAAADEIAGIDFHPNAKAQCLELARGFARRLRTRAAGAES